MKLKSLSGTQAGKIARELFEVKLKMDKAKILYGKYDKLLEKLLEHTKNPIQVKKGSDIFVLQLVDNFSKKNTAWKSTALRRYDIEVLRVK